VGDAGPAFAQGLNTLPNEKLIELRRSTHNGDGWCVVLNGTDVVGFFGPNARLRAERQRDELARLMSAPVPPTDTRDDGDQ
jgi:hypothetical protein